MAITLYGVIELTPLWRKQDPSEDYLDVKLVLQVFGLLISFFSLPIWFLANFNQAALNLLDQSSLIFELLSIYSLALFTALFLSPLIVYLLSKYTDYLEEEAVVKGLTSFFGEMEDALKYAAETEDSMIGLKVVTIYLFFIGYGYLAGILYFVIFLLPIYLIYFFSVLFLVIFLSSSSILLLFAMLVSWIINLRWLLNWRLRSSDRDPLTDQRTEYDVTPRSLDIIASNKEPIVCPGCRSFIAADKKECPVCGESISK